MRHIIVGNGGAGMAAADRLRKLAPNDEITVITRESRAGYAKIMLPDVLGGTVKPESVTLRTPEWYAQRGIELLRENAATRLDATGRQLHLWGGQRLPYDRLLWATGSTPFIPPCEGLEFQRVHTVTAWQDIETLAAHAAMGRRALVVGGGPTGLEIAFALLHRGMTVTVLEAMAHPLPGTLDDQGGAMLTALLTRAGLRVLCGTRAARYESAGEATLALPSGEQARETFDLLVYAVGTRPDLSALAGCGMRTARGAIVDAGMRTSLPDVYAAGDVAEWEYTDATGVPRTMGAALWSSAMAQGRVAAENMVGGDAHYMRSALLGSAMLFRDFPFHSIGDVRAYGANVESTQDLDADRGSYRRLIYRDGKLVGFVLIGDLGDAKKMSGEVLQNLKQEDNEA